MHDQPPARHQPARHRDAGHILLALTEHVWVRCPRCENAARISQVKGWTHVLTCGSCGLSTEDASPSAGRSSLGVQRRAAGPLRCNGCGGAQPVRIRSGRHDHEGRLTAQIRCRGCGCVGTYPLLPVNEQGKDEGRYLGLELFLSEPVGAHRLWAVNLLHLDQLEAWLRADLRERPLAAAHTSMIERLPRWLKLASARVPALRAVERMRAAAAQAGLV